MWLENIIEVHQDVSVDMNLLHDKANSLHEHFSDLEEGGVKQFNDSIGWFHSFVKHYNLKFLRLPGKAPTFPNQIKVINEEDKYIPEQVFNP